MRGEDVTIGVRSRAFRRAGARDAAGRLILEESVHLAQAQPSLAPHIREVQAQTLRDAHPPSAFARRAFWVQAGRRRGGDQTRFDDARLVCATQVDGRAK